MAKKKNQHKNYLSIALFLVGLVFLVESVAVGFVIMQLPTSVIGSASVAWGYVTLKFVAAVGALLGSVYTTIHH